MTCCQEKTPEPEPRQKTVAEILADDYVRVYDTLIRGPFLFTTDTSALPGIALSIVIEANRS